MSLSPRIVAGLVAVVLLGGGSVAFVILRERSEREARVSEVLREVDRELGALPTGANPTGTLPTGATPPGAGALDVDSIRLLLRRVESTNREIPSAELEVAEARLSLALGRTQAAWEVVRPHATAPGAADAALLVGAQVLQAVHAENGDVGTGRQALALADEHAQRTGSDRSRFRAWQMAYRVADLTAFASLSAELVDSPEELLAASVRATVVDLAAALADRLGIERDAIRDGAEGDAGRLWAAREAGGAAGASRDGASRDGASRDGASLAELDDLAGRFPEAPAELSIVATKRVLEEVGGLSAEQARGAAAEGMLRDGEGRANRLLEEFPSSVEARHLAVVALIATRQAFGLDDAGAARFRGHLQWLLRHASERDVRRGAWQHFATQVRR